MDIKWTRYGQNAGKVIPWADIPRLPATSRYIPIFWSNENFVVILILIPKCASCCDLWVAAEAKNISAVVLTKYDIGNFRWRFKLQNC